MPAQFICPHCRYGSYLWSDETEACVTCGRCRKSTKLGEAPGVRQEADRSGTKKHCSACGQSVEKTLRICPFCAQDFGSGTSELRDTLPMEKLREAAELPIRNFLLTLFGVFGLIVAVFIIAGSVAKAHDVLVGMVIVGMLLFLLLICLAAYRLRGAKTGLVVTGAMVALITAATVYFLISTSLPQ